MKVISKPTKNPAKPWIGAKVTCLACNCQVELEDGDDVQRVYDDRDGDYFTCSCPGCRASLTLSASACRKV